MPEPASHTAAAVALSGVGAGATSAVFGLDPGALFWAFLGALCSRAIQPRITETQEILQAGGFGVISTVLGTFGAAWTKPAAIYYAPYLISVDATAIIALPAFVLGLVGHEAILRLVGFIREFRKGGAV